MDREPIMPKREEILNTIGLENTMTTFEKADLFSWNECEAIWKDFTSITAVENRKKLCDNLLLDLQQLGSNYYIKVRQKDPISLIRKIVNNKQQNDEKYGQLNSINYNKFVTDIIGARIIIKSKAEWRCLHEKLNDIFNKYPQRKISKPSEYVTLFQSDPNIVYFAENPVAYVVSDNEKSLYRESGADLVVIKQSKKDIGYRSVHYIIKYKDSYIEIQVRTIFEEGWSECDHELVYKTPEGRKKETLKRTSNILSELAHQADEIVDYMNIVNKQQPNNCRYPEEECYANI